MRPDFSLTAFYAFGSFGGTVSEASETDLDPSWLYFGFLIDSPVNCMMRSTYF